MKNEEEGEERGGEETLRRRMSTFTSSIYVFIYLFIYWGVGLLLLIYSVSNKKKYGNYNTAVDDNY